MSRPFVSRREEVNLPRAPWYGKLCYYLAPYRRQIVLDNLDRVFGHVLSKAEIVQLAQAYYGHNVRFLFEYLTLPFYPTKLRARLVRVENVESPARAVERGKGLIILTGHFGNFEVTTGAALAQFPQHRGRFHFIRRTLRQKPLDDFVKWRFRRAGFGVLGKEGSLNQILKTLENNDIVVVILDQHAGGREGVVVDFCGHPASTFKSLAILALSTGTPIVPASSWREPDGTHVLRFEEPLEPIECDSPGEEIRRNTRAYNEALEKMLLAHPEQWIWIHKRWKVDRPGK